MTDQIEQLANRDVLGDPSRRQTLATALRTFVRMYRPHAAREETVLFPAFRKLVSPDGGDLSSRAGAAGRRTLGKLQALCYSFPVGKPTTRAAAGAPAWPLPLPMWGRDAR